MTRGARRKLPARSRLAGRYDRQGIDPAGDEEEFPHLVDRDTTEGGAAGVRRITVQGPGDGGGVDAPDDSLAGVGHIDDPSRVDHDPARERRVIDDTGLAPERGGDDATTARKVEQRRHSSLTACG